MYRAESENKMLKETVTISPMGLVAVCFVWTLIGVMIGAWLMERVMHKNKEEQK